MEEKNGQDMSKCKFQLAYDGPAVNGEMDAKELATPLFALSELFQEANLILNGSRSELAVKVKADFCRGSFEVNFEILQRITDFLLPFLSNEKQYSARDIAVILGFIANAGVLGAGLIKALKWLKGEKFHVEEPLRGKFILVTKHGKLEVQSEALKLIKNKKIRKDTYELLQPIKAKNIERFEIREDSTVVESVNKDELYYFQVKDDQEKIISDFTVIKICQLITISFEKELSWKLFDGEQRFSAKMSDVNFLKRMGDENIAFKKNDRFKMKIKTCQKVDSQDDIKISHEIIEVIEPYHPPEQMEFDL